MGHFAHLSRRNAVSMTGKTISLDGLEMTNIAGEVSLGMPGVRVGPVFAGTHIRKHRHRPHPLTPFRPTGFYRPELAVMICVIVTRYARTGRMPMTGVALGFRLCPGKGANILRISGTVAMAVDIVTDLPFLIVTGRVTVVDIPLRGYGHIFSAVDMFFQVYQFPGSINCIIVAVITGILSDPLWPDKTVMTVGRHGEVRSTGIFGSAPVSKAGAID
jgi:hypothetical protein